MEIYKTFMKEVNLLKNNYQRCIKLLNICLQTFPQTLLDALPTVPHIMEKGTAEYVLGYPQRVFLLSSHAE